METKRVLNESSGHGRNEELNKIMDDIKRRYEKAGGRVGVAPVFSSQDVGKSLDVLLVYDQEEGNGENDELKVVVSDKLKDELVPCRNMYGGKITVGLAKATLHVKAGDKAPMDAPTPLSQTNDAPIPAMGMKDMTPKPNPAVAGPAERKPQPAMAALREAVNSKKKVDPLIEGRKSPSDYPVYVMYTKDNLRSAVGAKNVNDAIAKMGKLQPREWAAYKSYDGNAGRFHNATDEKFLLAFGGTNHYWEAQAKNNPEIAKKRVVANNYHSANPTGPDKVFENKKKV